MVARADEKELSLCADGEHAVTAVRGRDKEGRWSGGGNKVWRREEGGGGRLDRTKMAEIMSEKAPTGVRIIVALCFKSISLGNIHQTNSWKAGRVTLKTGQTVDETVRKEVASLSPQGVPSNVL